MIEQKLTAYRKKRSFAKTVEPAGSQIPPQSGGLSFVIQKHKASRLHYDLRLESEGVLKSWAVPRGMPTGQERRLAIEVEDHPLEYKDFEGVIAENSYGAGSVIIWDEGDYYIDENLSKKENQRLVKKELKDGRLHFRLSGKKLKARFTLVKINRSKKPNWLLIKSKGQKAIEPVSEKSVRSGRNVEELGKSYFLEDDDLDKVRRAPLPEQFEVMKATLIDEPFDNAQWLFEVKWDGYRVLARIENKRSRLLSRNNKDLSSKFPSIVESLSGFPLDVVFDGEIVAVDEAGVSRFGLLQEFLSGKKAEILFYVFDILFFDGFDIKNLPLSRRKEILKAVLPKTENVRYSDFVREKGKAFFVAVKKAGLEGLVAKNRGSSYQSGRRSRDWLKIKASLTGEAVIAGFTMPEGSRKFLGALLLGAYENGRLIFIGGAGSGFSYQSLKQTYERLKPIIQDNCPFFKFLKTNAKAVWVKPEFVCQVKFREWTKEGLMRHPVFLGLRLDLDPQAVSRELPKDKDEVLTKEKNNSAKLLVEAKSRLTNLDKVYWPKEGYTKADMIDYYQKVSPVIIYYLKDRPQSLNRYPDGIEGENFFQKNVQNLAVPNWIKTVSVRSESKNNITYIICQDKHSLAYINNLGCIEINAWNSRFKLPDNPDYMVFDLDPVNVGFDKVSIVALEIRRLLQAVDIKSYCKTSGSRGIHIFTGLKGKYTFGQVKDFAQIISMLAHKELPQLTSLKRSPKDRSERVYIDYLQNHYAATMAAVYSLRPRPGAPVSCPLEWGELEKGANPLDFNIKTMPLRIKEKGDLWQGILEETFDMEKSIKLLEDNFYA